MCWILQKWFYICSGVEFVYANIDKIIIGGYKYYKNCNCGKVLHLFLPRSGNYFSRFGICSGVEVSLLMWNLLCYRRNNDGDKGALISIQLSDI